MSVEVVLLRRRPARSLSVLQTLLLLLFAYAAGATAQQAARNPAAGGKIIETPLPGAFAGARDAGPAPSSQRIVLTLTLAPSAGRVAALDQLLLDLNTSSSPRFHHWLTPQSFAASYGATSEQMAAATQWLAAQGLRIEAISPSAMRLQVSGFTSQIESAFGTSIHAFQAGGGLYFANTSSPSLPPEAASLFTAIDGLDGLPLNSRRAVTADPASSTSARLSPAAFGDQIDGNAAAILTLDAPAQGPQGSTSQIAEWSALFRQGAAQGITMLVPFTSLEGGFLAAMPDVTAIALAGEDATPIAYPFAARPVWQQAIGLPSDSLRHAPDLAVPTLSALTQALASISLETGDRLGNIGAMLYSLAPVAGLFTHPDMAAAGTWEQPSGLGLVDTARLVKVYPHGSATSTLAVTSSANAPTHGQGFVLTAIAASNNGGTAPTGTVTFTAPQAGFPSSSVNLNASGVAQSQSYIVPGGTYSIAAAYSGDAGYAPVTSTITVTVQPEAAIFTITAPASVSLGNTIPATVTLSSASGVGTPSASVTVTPSGITGAQAVTQTLAGSNGTASASYTFTSRQAGSVSLQASCTSNDASFTCYTPQTSITTVPLATPAVALSITPMNPTAGAPVTLAASVTGVAGIGPTGSVQFFDGNNSIGFGSAPSATFSGTLSPGASHLLTAIYQGDSNYLKATSNAINTTVGTAATTTAVNASATAATFGQSITLNVTVATSTVVNGTQPSGTLTFTGAGTITSAPVSGGSANVTLNSLGVGTYTIGTSYSGDTNYAASVGNTVVLTVTQAGASLNTSLSSTSFTTGSTSTLTATVTLPGNAQLPLGTTFIATIVGVTGASYTGTFAVNPGGNTGTGAVIIPAPIAGTYTMQVVCGTNANFTCSPNTLSISSTSTTGGGGATGTTPTTTVLTFSPISPAAGQTITLTATVSAAAAAIAANPIGGKVNFLDGTTLAGTGTIATVAGSAVATASVKLSGSSNAHTLTAVFSGDPIYAPSTSPASSLTLAAAGANVVLTSNVTTTVAGTNVVLTAAVTGSTATSAAPTGIVSFYVTGITPALIGTAVVGSIGNGAGQAVFSTNNLPAGSIIVYAIYNGDANFGMATSNNLTLGVSDYSVSFVPQTLSIVRGRSASATVVVSGLGSFTGTILFACAPPAGIEITCGFNPINVTPGGSTTLIVTTTAPKGQALGGSGAAASLKLVGGATLAGMLCLLFPAGRRGRIPAMLLVLLSVALTMNLGCGQNTFSQIAATDAGTPLGSTLLSITSTGTQGGNSVRHNYTYQVTVQ